ncbi:MAG: hypothetical protein WCK42_03075 [Myxococcaceae bacterium]
MFSKRKSIILTLILLSSISSLEKVCAETAEDFYRGQSISMYVGSGVGGGYDAVARVVSRNLSKHIPGRPNIIVKNMPGAGGLTNANYMYSVAPRDGLSIAAPFNTALLLPIFKDPIAKFDPREFTWIGSTDKQQGVCVTWNTSSVKTLQDAKLKTVLTGTTGLNATPGTFPFLLNTVLDTKFRIIGGYQTSELRLALERGEIESICGLAIQTHLAVNAHWFRDKLVNELVQFGLTKHRALPNVPLALELMKNDDDRKLLEFIMIPHEFGRPFIAPPGIAGEKRDALRAAFSKMIIDQDFLTESERSQQFVDPLTGAEIHELLKRAYDTPQAIIDKATAILRGPEPG